MGKMEENEFGAVKVMYKSLRLRRFTKGDDKYKIGIRLNGRNNIGILFPFAKNYKIIAKGIKTILGITYSKKIFTYWIPKTLIVKENLFKNKRRMLNKSPEIDLTLELPDMTRTESVYRIRNSKNTVFDYSRFIKNVIPDFNSNLWSRSRVVANIDLLIVELLEFMINSANNSSPTKTFKVTKFMYGGSVVNTHSKIIIGLEFSIMDQSYRKYINPSLLNIPRYVKADVESYIMILIFRALIAGQMNITEDEILNRLYKLLKDYTLVFYNNRGIGFIYNTSEDPYVLKYTGTRIYGKYKQLFEMMVNYNDPTYVGDDDIELDDPVEEKAEIIDEKRFNKQVIMDSKLKLENDKIDLITNRINNMTDDEIKEISPEDEDEDVKSNGTIDEIDESEDENDDEKLEGPDENTIPIEDDEVDDEPDEDISDLVKTVKNNDKPTITPAQRRRIEKYKDKYKSIKLDGRSIDEIINDEKATKLVNKPINVKVKDSSIRSSKLLNVEKEYLEKTFEKDLISMITGFGSGKTKNLYLTNLTKEDTSDQLTQQYTYTFEMKDVDGKSQTVKVNIPKIDGDGFMHINGSTKYIKKQLTLKPVVKIKPDRVMISTNYNKTFLFRHGTVIDNNVGSLKKLISKELKNSTKFKIKTGDDSNSNGDVITTIEYDTLSSSYHEITIGTGTNRTIYMFNQKNLREFIKSKKPKYKFNVNELPIGYDFLNNDVIIVKLDDSAVSICNMIFNDLKRFKILPDVDKIISNMNIVKRRTYTIIMVMNRKLPLIAFLGGLFGLSEVINREKINVEFSEKRIRNDPRVYIKFNDGYLYYNEENRSASLLLNGLAYMDTENYDMSEFDGVEPYVDMLFNKFKTRNDFKGFTALKELFIDNITLEVLRELKLPTDFLELFLYSNSLLTDNSSSPETNMTNYRLRGYEVIPVLLYKAVATQYRMLKQNNIGTGRINIPKDIVMIGLQNSMIMENYDDTNPMNYLKIKSTVTFKGPGGINSSRTMNKSSRYISKDGIGNIAISGPDGSGIGIVKQLTLDPNIRSTRGYIEKHDINKVKSGNLASPEELDVAFGFKHDDPKRTSFVSGQTKHIIRTNNNTPYIVSSGMDKLSAQMVGDGYVPKAKGDGKVTVVDRDKGILIVEYVDKTTESFDIGEVYKRNSSYKFVANIEPNVKVGQKVKENDILAYDSDFYKKTAFGIKSAQGRMIRVAIHERDYTDEDASAISYELASKLSSRVAKVKKITLDKFVNIITYPNIGDKFLKGDTIMTFEDSRGEDVSKLLDELGTGDGTEEILAMSRQAPKAPITGELTNINIYFTCPLEELSPSLNRLVNRWIKTIKDKIKIKKDAGADTSRLETMLTKTVPNMNKINGTDMPEDGGVLIEYTFSHDNSMGVGDKVTYHGNLKSEISHIFEKDKYPVTESGDVIDAVMGSLSISARMIHSIYFSGVLSLAMVDKGKEIAKEYLK